MGMFLNEESKGDGNMWKKSEYIFETNPMGLFDRMDSKGKTKRKENKETEGESSNLNSSYF